ncbi:hypothetical protein KSP40_PGU002020 [Platanthera guangdongensis]|uniref:Uncharacterized protein n=1 Tax=Platanthera guangdongensis TaxID=2320717 RepID=A0ABR2N0K4_9ASPA
MNSVFETLSHLNLLLLQVARLVASSVFSGLISGSLEFVCCLSLRPSPRFRNRCFSHLELAWNLSLTHCVALAVLGPPELQHLLEGLQSSLVSSKMPIISHDRKPPRGGSSKDEPRESTFDERTDPVDPIPGEISGCDGRAEGAGRVHQAPAKGPGGEDVCADDEVDGDGGDGAERAFLRVGGGGIDGVDQGESDDDLHYKAVELSHVGGDAVGGDGLASGDELEEEASDDGAQ